MTTRAGEQTTISREFLAKADVYLAAGDLLQASEKGWGAAAHMVKSVAHRRGWKHDGHRELYRIVNQLAQEKGSDALRQRFDSAGALHSNFYENWMPAEMVAASLKRVKELVSRLEALAQQHGDTA